jgi:hypothetical protein
MARANALLIVPPERPLVRANETLDAMLLGDESMMSDQLDL